MSMKRQKHRRINQWFYTFLLIGAISVIQPGFPLSDKRHTDPASLPEARIAQFVRHHHWHQAADLLKVHLEKFPLDFDARTRLLEIYLLADDFEAAQHLVSQTYFLYPQSIEPLVLDGYSTFGLLVGQGDVPQEETRLNHLNQLAYEAEYLDPDHPEALYLKGLAAKLQADSLKAEEFLLRVIYQNPTHLRAKHALVDLYADIHETRLATPVLSQALEEDARHVDTLYLVGRLFIEKGDPERGLVYLKQSQEVDGIERPKRLLMMAEAYRQLGKAEDAMLTYQKVLDHWPDRADLWQQYARMADALGREDIVITAYQHAVKLQPAVLGQLIAEAQTVFWTKPLIEAVPAYYRLVRIAPHRADLLLLLVHLHYRLWQEGVPPGQSRLDALEARLRELEMRELTPPLQLADVQIQVMRLNGWSPGLRETAQELVHKAKSPFFQAIGEIIIEHPAHAKPLGQDLGNPKDPALELQRLALSGAWPWALAWVKSSPRLEARAAQVETWAEADRKKANTHYAEAMMYIRQKQPEQALDSLQKARVYQPLAPALQLYLAEAYLLYANVEAARLALENARLLGTETLDANWVGDLEKQIRLAQQAQKQQNTSQNQAPSP